MFRYVVQRKKNPKSCSRVLSLWAMASYAFSGNPVIPGKQSGGIASDLLNSLAQDSSPSLQILPLCNGKPLVAAFESGIWRLAWQSFVDVQKSLNSQEIGMNSEEIRKNLVYLGEKEGLCYCAVDASPVSRDVTVARSIAQGFGEFHSFVDLRTLMVAADWANDQIMGELSIAGHARALLEWHCHVKYCGRCGTATNPCDAGQRRKCSSSVCQFKFYPRIDPVVIMLVIDKERDRALLAHQPKYVPQMWSCLAGFIEPGESLEEAVRRETKEETNVEVGEVIYHSSQPWPVGPSNMSCQLMVGFFAVAKTFDVQVDKKELEDARWHSREDIQKALAKADYSGVQKATGLKVYQMCSKGDEERPLNALRAVAQGEGIFVPGPFAIAHHLIATWASKGSSILNSKI